MASFRKRGDKWEYRIKYTDPSNGKRREKTKSGFRTKKEAQIEAAEIEKKLYLRQHSILQNEAMLIKDWFEEWLHTYGSQGSRSTLENRKNYIKNHIIPKLGHYHLSSLPRSEYQKFINNLTNKYAITTVRTIHSIFCSSINKAVNEEKLAFNKYQGISIKKENDIAEEKKNYLTKEEVHVFMTAAKSCAFHHYIIASMLLRTGMRKGELIALDWSDIDFKKKTISITKSRNENRTKAPKTKSSIRTIKIGDVLIEELEKYRLWQKKNKMKFGADYHTSNYVITTPRGKEIGPFGINKVIDTILAKTNLHHITPHGLRHTHAIMVLESGADIKYVSTRLGHATVNMTADVYIHITEKYDDRNVDKLDSYLN